MRARARIACLEDHELALALVRDFQERLAGHVLDARVRLVHELEQLVDHRLEEFPVVAQEPRVLAHHVPAMGGRKHESISEL